MAEYRACPNCGNSKRGIIIYRCKKCGKLGCYSSGDRTTCFHNECPHCGTYGQHEKMGEVS